MDSTDAAATTTASDATAAAAPATAPATAPGDAPTRPGGEPPAPGAVAPDWIGGLDPATRQLVETKGWKTPGDALNSYAALERTLGSEKVALPPKSADGERDWSQWDGWSALGRPESPDAYQFSPIEGTEFTESDQALHAAIAPAAHAAGLAPWQLAKLNEAFNSYGTNMLARAEEAAGEARAELQREWGGQFDQQIALANRVVQLAFGEDIEAAKQVRLADGRYLLDDPRLARAFARLGTAMGEDGVLAAGSASPGQPTSPAAAEAEIARLRAEAHSDPKHALNDRQHPEHEAINQRMLELYRLAEQKGSGATV